jgi:hypothetical protein
MQAFADTTERQQLWSSLADLYLDTDVRPSLALHALSLLNSALDEAAWDWIFQHEVTPAVYRNLQCVAGEWAGFDAAWLREQILAHRDATLALSEAQRARRYRAQGLADPEWRACKAFAHLLAPLAADARLSSALLLYSLGWTYFEPDVMASGATHRERVANATANERVLFADALRIYSELRGR